MLKTALLNKNVDLFSLGFLIMEAGLSFYVLWDHQEDREIRIVGNCDALGNNDETKGKKLKKLHGKLNFKWVYETETLLPKNKELEYYYFIVNTLDGEVESRSEKRILKVQGSQMLVDDGRYSSNSNLLSIWTRNNYQIRLTFGELSEESRRLFIKFFGTAETDVKKILIFTKNRSQKVELEYPLINPLSDISFAAANRSELNIYVHFLNSTNQVVGKSFGIYSSFSDSGELVWPIIQEEEIIGEIKLEYLLVTPFWHKSFDLPEVQQQGRVFYKHKDSKIYVGHRGSGANNARVGDSHLLENSLLAFKNAEKAGADYVEFDVHVSSDNIPVIFHDFIVPLHFPASPSLRKIKIPISSISNEEFKLISWLNKEDHENQKMTHDEYPTLDDLFQYLNFAPKLGFNIEVKFPSVEEFRRDLPASLLSRNKLIDRILTVVFDHLKDDRPIYFSTFDPESCILLSQKQPKYPVFLLTESGTAIYPSDPRKNSLENAAEFCRKENLFGFISIATPLVQDPQIIKPIKELSAGILLLTWGSENNDIELVQLQENNGVDGIISDHNLNPRPKEQSTLSAPI